MQIGQYLPTSFPNPINFVKGRGKLCAIVALALVVIACLARKRSPSLSAHAKLTDDRKTEVEKIRAFQSGLGITEGNERLKATSNKLEFKGKPEWPPLSDLQRCELNGGIAHFLAVCQAKIEANTSIDPVQKRQITLDIPSELGQSWGPQDRYPGASKLERIAQELVEQGVFYSSKPSEISCSCWDIQA